MPEDPYLTPQNTGYLLLLLFSVRICGRTLGFHFSRKTAHAFTTQKKKKKNEEAAAAEAGTFFLIRNLLPGQLALTLLAVAI